MSALARAERRSFVRACTAMMLGARQGVAPERVLKTWDDPRAEKILKAASGAATTASGAALQLTSTTILPLLAPASASARVLALARSLDLSGLQAIKLPYIGVAGRPPAVFVAEDSPGPVVDLVTSATTLGPTKKLLILAALTREMTTASASNAEVIVSDALALSVAQGLDTALFSNAAATASAPAGLLNGITPMPSTGTTGAAGVADDIALLAGAIANAGINPDDMTIITNPAMGMKLRTLASPLLTNVVMSSSSIVDGTLIGIVARGLATGYDGGVEIDASKEAAVHFEQTTPLPIVDGSGVVGHPVYSAMQSDVSVLKIRGRAAWAVHPGAVAQVTGAEW
jgi:hypothetical protein